MKDKICIWESYDDDKTHHFKCYTPSCCTNGLMHITGSSGIGKDYKFCPYCFGEIKHLAEKNEEL
jgi:hypothetical protein